MVVEAAVVVGVAGEADSNNKDNTTTSTTDDLGFSYEELKVLVELCYSENLASERREVAVQAKRQLNDQLLALSEHTWRSE